MTDHFPKFAEIVAASFKRLVDNEHVLVTSVKPDELYELYLKSFPPGTNPVFRERTEHDCTCCKQFIRRAGIAVSVDSKYAVTTVWDDAAENAPYPYDVVSRAMRDVLRVASVVDLYRVSNKDDERSFGVRQSLSTTEDKRVLKWNHFYTDDLPKKLRVESPGETRSERRAEVQVFSRGLVELSPEAVSAVLALIDANNLYRGEEHRAAVVAFQKAQETYAKLDEASRRVFSWVYARGKFRNSAIGTLVDDLSAAVVVEDAGGESHRYHPARLLRTSRGELTAGDLATAWRSGSRENLLVNAARGQFDWEAVDSYEVRNVRLVAPLEDVEGAVKAFESKVAPDSYKRTTAVITPAMVEKATEMIRELGLEPALERRFARIEDISVTDVKWVDGTVRPLMRGGIADVLMKHVAATATRGDASTDEERAEEIALDDFVAKVLRETTSFEILFKNEHLGNLVSLTAPVHPESRQLFRWDNDFAWSYRGNVADSMIAERVKKAGGKVEGAAMRVSLSWSNYDDLDIHVFEPQGRGVNVLNEIFFRNRRGWTGGELDVDMNAGIGRSREPVENVVWMQQPPDGAYKIVVHNYCKRETSNPGFVVEVEVDGKISRFAYNKAVRDEQNLHVATLHLNKGTLQRVEPGDPAVTTANVSVETWGLTTEQYARVSCVTLSPNYWGRSAVGNRHTFFFLEKARCDEPTRGIYNEFLHPRLESHRKVFEVIGDKTKCQPTEGQLSGLGFSSTKRDSFVARIQQGGKRKLYRVRVGA